MNPDLLSDSPTVATLNARAELRKLRMLVNPNDDAARAEIDRLEDLLSDALTLEDGTGVYVTQAVVDQEYVTRDTYNDLEKERDDAEADRDKAEARIKELEDSLDESEDESKKRLAGALAECARLRAVAERTEKQRDELRKTPAAQQLTQRVRDALFPLPRGAKGKAAEAFERLAAAVRKALEVQP